MVATHDYTVLVTDKSLTVVGDPIYHWATLDVTLRFNEPGVGLVTCPGHPWVLDQLQPGNRMMVIRDGAVLMAGPIEKWFHERSDDGPNAGVGKLSINFADDMATIAARQAYPNPAQTPDAQTTDWWTWTGNAELALRSLVDNNAGPSALADRRIPLLALGALAGVGTDVTVKTQRMQPLGEVARQIADIGGTLGFRTRQVGTEILFEVFDPPDRSAEARFGFNLGNMKYLAYEVSAPEATAIIIGGQGEGSARRLMERLNAAELATWGRTEKLVSRDGSVNLIELEEEGDRALATAAATIRIPISIADSENAAFGVHYGIGDKVALETAPGVATVDIVRVVHIAAWPTAGEIISSTVGSQASNTDPVWIKRVREIDERLGRIERIVTPNNQAAP